MHRPAGPDHFADLVGRDGDRLDARRMLAKIRAGVAKRFRHLAEDVQPAVARLIERRLHDLGRDTGDLDVHLERSHALGRTGNLEVHVAEMILVADDVRQNRDAIRFLDEAHGDASNRRFQRNACVHHRQRSAADACHG